MKMKLSIQSFEIGNLKFETQVQKGCTEIYCKKGLLDSVPQSRYGGYADFSEGVLGSTYITRISQYFFALSYYYL